MLGVCLVCVFHNEVVDAKDEGYLAADVSEDPGSLFAWNVPSDLDADSNTTIRPLGT